MAIPRLLNKPTAQAVKCLTCPWTGLADELREIEGFCCPKCGEPLFPPEWLQKPPRASR